MTRQASTATDIRKETTATPPKPSTRARSQTPPDSEQFQDHSSPPGDTQAFSQFVYPPRAFADEVQDEAEEGVWGYIIPLDDKVRDALVLRKRGSCDGPASKSNDSRKDTRREAGRLANKAKAPTPGGYLVGRHPECGKSWRQARFAGLWLITSRSCYQHPHDFQSTLPGILGKQKRGHRRNLGGPVQQRHICQRCHCWAE